MLSLLLFLFIFFLKLSFASDDVRDRYFSILIMLHHLSLRQHFLSPEN